MLVLLIDVVPLICSVILFPFLQKTGRGLACRCKAKKRPYSLCLLCLLLSAVSVGYEYESCPDLILWEKRTAVLQGYEIDASRLGGWSLDKHHALNIQSGEWVDKIPRAQPCCGVLRALRDKTHTWDFTGSYGIHRSEGLVYECSWGPCSGLVTAGLWGSRIERPHEFTVVRGQHFPGNFYAVPWPVPSQREQGHWGFEEGHVTQLHGWARYLFGENFWTESQRVRGLALSQVGRGHGMCQSTEAWKKSHWRGRSLWFEQRVKWRGQ